jgi:quercetin dioxygenase-like cupin family protein
MSLELVSTGQWTPTSVDQLLIEGAPHGAKVTVILQDMPQGSGPRLHWHPYGETWVVISGTISFFDRKEVREAGPGDVVYIAPREPHGFKVLSEGRIKMVCIHQSEKAETNWLE